MKYSRSTGIPKMKICPFTTTCVVLFVAFTLSACGSPEEEPDGSGVVAATGGEASLSASGGESGVGGSESGGTSSGGAAATGGDGSGAGVENDCLPTETSCLRAEAQTDAGLAVQTCAFAGTAKTVGSVAINCNVDSEELRTTVQFRIPDEDGVFSGVPGEDTGFVVGAVRTEPYLWVTYSDSSFESGEIEGTKTTVDGVTSIVGTFSGSWSSGGSQCEQDCGPVVLEGRFQVEVVL